MVTDNRAIHGEYKMPGGKLVVADLQSRDGKLDSVRISGDFFLDPDSALDDIDAALNGQSVTATAETLTESVRAALDNDVRMYGVSPEAIAMAVRRALDGQA